MAVNYSLPTINGRLQAVINGIDGGGGNGNLYLLAANTVVSTIQLARPSGTVNGGVLTFAGTLLDPAAATTGIVDTGVIKDSTGTTVISGLTVGIPLFGGDIVLNNGLNNTLVSSGQTVQLLSAQITGS